MADHFLMKSSHPAESCLLYGADPVLAAYSQLQEVLTRHLGAEAARLFAEPFVSRDRSGQIINLAWYGPQGGTARPLSTLDPEARRIAEDRLHVLLPRIETLAEDPALAPLIRAALSVGTPDDILTIDGYPILVNWGVASQSGVNPLDGFLRAASTGMAAPSARTDTPAPRAPQPQPVLVQQNAAQAMPAAMLPLQSALAREHRLPLVAWLPLVILLGLATLALVWVLLPGTRIFPAAELGSIEPATVDAAARAELEGLRARRDALQAALSGAQCRPDGRLVLPGNMSPEGIQVPAPGAPDPVAAQPIAPDAPVAPAPERVSVPVPSQQGSPEDTTSSLLDTVEASTVLVVAGNAQGVSTGSGFVVGPGLIVTNLHVVDGALPDQIIVTNKRLGRAEPAKILKVEGPFDTVGRDFALLQIASTALPAFVFANPSASQKLHHIVAAGFPGDVMETDAAFNKLLQGDASAIPDLVVVDGTINAKQEMPHDAQVLVHSAPLSSGNSGGPLVDFCGRVLGVNTFVRQGPMRTLNFAISTETLAHFLEGTSVQVAIQTSDCTPQVLPQTPTPLTASTTPAVPDAPATPSDGTAKVAP